MTAPTVRNWAAPTNVTDSLPAFALTLPTRVAGDLLLAFVAGDYTTSLTQSGGTWAEIQNVAGASNRLGIFARIATNDANDNISIAGANNQDSSCVVCSIQNHGVVTLATDIKIGTAATGSSAAADPPSADGGASRDWLALAMAVVDLTATGSSISGYPANYSAGVLTKSASSTSSVGLGVGQRALTAATTEDPGGFTNTSGAWVTQTVLVPPFTLVIDPAETAHTSSADTAAVTDHAQIAPDQTVHGSTADASSVVVTGAAAAADTVHGHTADQATISTGGEVTPPWSDPAYLAVLVQPAETAHGLSSDAATVDADIVIVPVDTHHEHTAGVASLGELLYPASVSGRRFLDQDGNDIILRNVSAWGLAQNLSDADITTVLETVAAKGFNAVNVWMFGGDYGGSGEEAWDQYHNLAGDPVFTGTPWQSSLGTAWESMDWVVTEAARLGLTVLMSVNTAASTYGYEDDVVAAGATNCYNVGVAVATRYLAYDNIVWHWMNDAATGSLQTPIEAFFDGINDTEGPTRRLRLVEPGQSSTAWSQYGTSFPNFAYSANSLYQYGDTAVDLIDAVMNESGATSLPVWDCEPPYWGAGHAGSATYQELRERLWSDFIRGAIGTNYGHEDFWPFGKNGLYSAGRTWQQTLTDPWLDFAEIAWTILARVLNTAGMTRDTGQFVTAGIGTGDTKAASAFSTERAIVYMPDARSVTLDLTEISGQTRVKIVRVDPHSGAETTLYADLATTGSQTVSGQGTNASGTFSDWVLLVEGLVVEQVDPVDAAHAHAADAASVTVTTQITPNETSHAHAADPATVSTTLHLVPDDGSHLLATEQANIVSRPTCVPAEAAHVHTAEVASVTTHPTVAPAETQHAHTADTSTVVNYVQVAPSEAGHTHTAEPASLVVTTQVAPSEAHHLHQADQAAIDTGGSTTLTPAEAGHVHSADAAALTTHPTLDPADAAHGHTADAAALTTHPTLTAAEVRHTQAADAASVTVHTQVAPSEAHHAHSAEPAGVTDHTQVAPNEARHLHAADAAQVDTQGSLTIVPNDGSHLGSADAATLVTHPTLAAAEARHAHTADAASVTLDTVIAPAEARHTQSADITALVVHTQVAPSDARNGHTADQATVTTHPTLAPAGAVHGHTADEAVIRDHLWVVIPNDVVALYLGEVEGIAAYLGDTLVWTKP